MTHTLGRLINHDPRSRGFVARGAAEQRSVLWGHHAPVINQGSLGSCTFSSLAQLINTDPFEICRPNGYLTQDDAIKGYSLATQLDEFLGQYPPEDTGSSGLAAAKAAVQLGYFQAYNHVFGFEHFTSVLQTQPLIVGTYWLDGMFDPDSSGQVHVTGKTAGGHEYLALGVNYETATLTFLNSWGADWGLGGRFTMSFRDFSYLLGQQGDATAPVIPVPAPPPPPTPPPVPPKPDTFCGKYRAIRAILAK